MCDNCGANCSVCSKLGEGPGSGQVLFMVQKQSLLLAHNYERIFENACNQPIAVDVQILSFVANGNKCAACLSGVQVYEISLSETDAIYAEPFQSQSEPSVRQATTRLLTIRL